MRVVCRPSREEYADSRRGAIGAFYPDIRNAPGYGELTIVITVNSLWCLLIGEYLLQVIALAGQRASQLVNLPPSS